MCPRSTASRSASSGSARASPSIAATVSASSRCTRTASPSRPGPSSAVQGRKVGSEISMATGMVIIRRSGGAAGEISRRLVPPTWARISYWQPSSHTHSPASARKERATRILLRSRSALTGRSSRRPAPRSQPQPCPGRSAPEWTRAAAGPGRTRPPAASTGAAAPRRARSSGMTNDSRSPTGTGTAASSSSRGIRSWPRCSGRRLPDSSKTFAHRWAGGSPAIS